MLKKLIVAAVACIGVCTFASTVNAVSAAERQRDPQTTITDPAVKKSVTATDYKAKVKTIQKKIKTAKNQLEGKKEKQFKLNKRYKKSLRKLKQSQSSLTQAQVNILNEKSIELSLLNKRLKSGAQKLERLQGKNKKIAAQRNYQNTYNARRKELKAFRRQINTLDSINTLLLEISNLILQ